MTNRETEPEELHESEARSRIVMETVSDAVITIDEASTILFANRAACRIFGYEVEDLRGAPLTMLMPEYLRHLHDAGMNRYQETGVKHISWDGVELPGLHRSGRELTLEISFGEYSDGSRRFFTGIARDITERKRAERRLAAQYAVTRILSETTSFAESVPRILQSVCESLGWETGALWNVDEDAQVLRHVEAWHTPAADLAEFEGFNARRTFARGAG
ncbi:MAG: PAS domain S-box protein, partial [Pyrinomonadaceae bacterium]